MGNEEDFSDKYSSDISMEPYLAFYARDGTPLKANARNWKNVWVLNESSNLELNSASSSR